MSSYQLKHKGGHRNFINLRRRRTNEMRRVAAEKKAMQKIIARSSTADGGGGSSALDAGRRMLGSVRAWALTVDDEYYSHPSPPCPLLVLDGQEAAGDEAEHCGARWRKVARTLLVDGIVPPPPPQEEEESEGEGEAEDEEARMARRAADCGPEPPPEPEPQPEQEEHAEQDDAEQAAEQEPSPDDEGEEEEEEWGEEEEWEEEELPYALYVLDYSAVSDELPAESAQHGLGPAAKPLARIVSKIAGDGSRLVACGPAALLACKMMSAPTPSRYASTHAPKLRPLARRQQPTVAERVSQLILIRPELPGGVVQTWLHASDKPCSTPVLVFGGGEGGLQYDAQRDGWVTGA